jgi:hypothetical protein
MEHIKYIVDSSRRVAREHRAPSRTGSSSRSFPSASRFRGRPRRRFSPSARVARPFFDARATAEESSEYRLTGIRARARRPPRLVHGIGPKARVAH